jgi:hypothetical protein
VADGSSATPWAVDYAAQGSEALLADLQPRRGGCGGWGVVRTAIFGFLTFGLAPALAWAFSVREQIDRDRDLYTRAADWFRFHSVHPEAGRLRAAAEGLHGRPFLSVLPIVCCLGLILFFVTSLGGSHDRIRAATRVTHLYPVAHRFHELREQEFQVSAADFDRRDRMYLVWVIGTSAAYLGVWLAVRSHRQALDRFADQFRAFAAAERLRPPVAVIPHEPVARWWIGAGVLAWLGLAWGPAAMLAAASRRRVVVRTSTPLRQDVAYAITEMARVRQGGGGVAAAISIRCARPACAAPLPQDARFCRRCGAAVPQ